jgi:Zn-dependent protease with chaperone function
MTALAKYDLLEAPGRYFDGETARSQDVIVKFGDATLMVLDVRDVPITHWSLAGLRDLSSGNPGDGLTLTPDPDGDERLMVDDAEMMAAIRAVCPDLYQRRKPSGSRVRKVAFWSVAALASLYLTVFHLVPALSDRLATMIPPEAEIAMGEEMTDQFAELLTEGEEAYFCASPNGDRALARMVTRLASRADPYIPLTVRILDHDMVNAFALPGGQIVIFRGLLRAADTPEEVAGVLAHEIGHVVARDPTRLTLRSAGSAGLLGLLLGDFTGATVTIALSEAILRSGYQREAETEADAFAAELLRLESLPTAPMADFFLKLKVLSGEAPSLLSHLSSHPDLQQRADITRAADSVGNAPFEPILSDQEWVALRNICQK